MRRVVLLFWLCLASSPAWPGEVLQAEVEHDDGRYFVEVDMVVNAQLPAIRAILTDYAHLTRVHENIKKSELLFSLDERTHQVRIVAEACVSFFCKSMVQTQDVEELDRNTIITTVVPEKSDFVYAHARWKLLPVDNGTRVLYNTDLKPGFWVPPVIGPLLIKQKMHNASVETILNLEKLALR